MYPTTQAVVGHYLWQRGERPSCVVNVGLHDEALHPAQPYDLFVWNSLSMLADGCASIVWLTTNAVRNSKHAQNNTRIAARNSEVIRRLPAQISVIDVFGVTNGSHLFNHTDNVHIVDVYYQKLASVLRPMHTSPPLVF